MVRGAIAILLLLALPTAAIGENRVALLIGNQSYHPSVGLLQNPHNDIALVGDALKRQGFEVLPVLKDARRSAMLGAVRDLVRRLNASGSGAVGFIYYSGHGASESDTGINYLIPVDAREPGSASFWDESLKLDDVIRLLDGARSAAKFLVFDACRNELRVPAKSTSKGFVPVSEQQGMFIAYASAAGRTASDRGDRSGPYAAALAAELLRPGLDHLSLFQNVKEAVYSKTAGVQQPWESNGLFRRVYLTGPPRPGQATQPDSSELQRAAAFIKETEDQARLEEFIRQFGDTPYGPMARARLDELAKKRAALPPPTSPQQLDQGGSLTTTRYSWSAKPTASVCEASCRADAPRCTGWRFADGSTCTLFEADSPAAGPRPALQPDRRAPATQGGTLTGALYGWSPKASASACEDACRGEASRCSGWRFGDGKMCALYERHDAGDGSRQAAQKGRSAVEGGTPRGARYGWSSMPTAAACETSCRKDAQRCSGWKFDAGNVCTLYESSR